MKIGLLPLLFSVFVPPAAQSSALILAAASLKDALDDVALSYNKEKNLQSVGYA